MPAATERPREEAPVAASVRPARAGDLPAVVALDGTVTGLAKPDYFADLFTRFGGDRTGRRFFLVAEGAGGGVIGFAIGEIRAWEFGSAPAGWVFAISVDPGARQRGVGAGLLAAMAARFRAAGVDTMRTMLARDDHLLMSFFCSQGMMAGPFIQLETALE